MKKLILILLLIIIFNNKFKEINVEFCNPLIIKDLILIKNTYNFVSNKKIKKDMIKRQKMLVVGKEFLYVNYLIESDEEY